MLPFYVFNTNVPGLRNLWFTINKPKDYIIIYIYAFSRRFYPKRLIQAIHFLSLCNLIQDRVTISVTVEINVFNVSSKIPFLSNILI